VHTVKNCAFDQECALLHLPRYNGISLQPLKFAGSSGAPILLWLDIRYKKLDKTVNIVVCWAEERTFRVRV